MRLNELTAKDLMQRDIKTISKNITLLKAAKMMHELGVSSLVIEPDDSNDAYGIITRKDIVELFFGEGNNVKLFSVEDVMTKPAITVDGNLSIDHCNQMMRMVGVRRLPVVIEGKLAGILSNSDIFRKLIES
jgi:CBS domain-containing protein